MAGLAVRGGGTSRPAPRIEEVSGPGWAGKRQGRGGGRTGGPATLTPQIPTPQVSSSWVLKPGSIPASVCHRGPAQPHRSNPPVGVSGLEGGREGGRLQNSRPGEARGMEDPATGKESARWPLPPPPMGTARPGLPPGIPELLSVCVSAKTCTCTYVRVCLCVHICVCECWKGPEDTVGGPCQHHLSGFAFCSGGWILTLISHRFGDLPGLGVCTKEGDEKCRGQREMPMENLEIWQGSTLILGAVPRGDAGRAVGEVELDFARFWSSPSVSPLDFSSRHGAPRTSCQKPTTPSVPQA